jgi:hypothetical protein
MHLSWALATSLLIAPAINANELSYWLRSDKGGLIVDTCSGDTQGRELRAANRDGKWILISGVIVCRDTGNTYSYEIKYLNVSINPARRDDISRAALDFDWLGMAVFRPKGQGESIEWLYDEALPIRGALSNASDGSVYFGNRTFSIAKDKMQKATHLLFYITAEGPVFEFELLP